MHSTEHDPEIYPDRDSYNPFRFLKLSVTSNTLDVHGKVNGAVSIELVATSDTFLPFSYGRYACPGRFFVALEMKLILAYMVMNYDFEALKNIPYNTRFGQDILPPMRLRSKCDEMKA